MTKHFIRIKEDFICENCGTEIKGTGFTNHCSNCLFSKHVDEEFPGDRKSGCLGLMFPIAGVVINSKYKITHKCIKCGKVTHTFSSKNDNFEEIVKIMGKVSRE